MTLEEVQEKLNAMFDSNVYYGADIDYLRFTTNEPGEWSVWYQIWAEVPKCSCQVCGSDSTDRVSSISHAKSWAEAWSDFEKNMAEYTEKKGAK